MNYFLCIVYRTNYINSETVSYSMWLHVIIIKYHGKFTNYAQKRITLVLLVNDFNVLLVLHM